MPFRWYEKHTQLHYCGLQSHLFFPDQVVDVWSFQALEEEKLVYERSSSKNIYLNVAVNTLKKLRSKSSSSISPATSMSLH